MSHKIVKCLSSTVPVIVASVLTGQFVGLNTTLFGTEVCHISYKNEFEYDWVF